MSMYPLFTAELAEAKARQLRRDAENARALALARTGRTTGGTPIPTNRIRRPIPVDAPRTVDRHGGRRVLARLLDELVRMARRSGIERGIREGGVP